MTQFDFHRENSCSRVNPERLMEGKDRRIVFLGKEGSGKSSLANTIFGVQNVFPVSSKAVSSTNTCKSETRQIYDRNITLIDTPGVLETDPRSTEHNPQLLQIIQECSPGPHAFLLVLKVERYTKQEQAMVDVILKYFSEEALKYTTVVFTHGDELPEDMEIKEWIRENKALNTLVQKCGGCCHVFDNRRWNNNQDQYRNNQHQVQELLRTIDQTVAKNGGKCYTNEVLTMIDHQIQLEVKNMSGQSNLTMADVLAKAKQMVYSKLMENMQGAFAGVLVGAFLGVGAMETLVLRCSPGQFYCVAAAVTGAAVGVPIGGLVGGWAPEKWSSPTEAAKDAVEFIKTISPLVEMVNQTGVLKVAAKSAVSP